MRQLPEMRRQSSMDSDTGNRTVPRVGEPAPWFVARSALDSAFHFDTAAGRYILLCFFGSAADDQSREVLSWIENEAARFDDHNTTFFGVSTDPDDERRGRFADRIPGMQLLWDFDRVVSRQFGLVGSGSSNELVARTTFVLDPMLRVLAVIPFAGGPERHNALLGQVLRQLPPMPEPEPVIAASHAPVLMIPHVFEASLCRRLIDLFETHGRRDSGSMRDVGGETVGLFDYTRQRRGDVVIVDDLMKEACTTRIDRRLVPQIERAFQFRPTQMERHIVARYDSASRAYLKPHRDNTTKDTAHRRFAVTINLNTPEYEGGLLRFPEYGPQLYAVPVGGALVFSCSLLHEVTPVTTGRRYAFLPFLYDDAAVKLREGNRNAAEDSTTR